MNWAYTFRLLQLSSKTWNHRVSVLWRCPSVQGGMFWTFCLWCPFGINSDVVTCRNFWLGMTRSLSTKVERPSTLTIFNLLTQELQYPAIYLALVWGLRYLQLKGATTHRDSVRTDKHTEVEEAVHKQSTQQALRLQFPGKPRFRWVRLL